MFKWSITAMYNGLEGIVEGIVDRRVLEKPRTVSRSEQKWAGRDRQYIQNIANMLGYQCCCAWLVKL